MSFRNTILSMLNWYLPNSSQGIKIKMKPFIPFTSPNHCIILMVLMHIIPMQHFLMDLITNHSFTFQARARRSSPVDCLIETKNFFLKYFCKNNKCKYLIQKCKGFQIINVTFHCTFYLQTIFNLTKKKNTILKEEDRCFDCCALMFYSP